jgi:hypothetical protein
MFPNMGVANHFPFSLKGVIQVSVLVPKLSLNVLWSPIDEMTDYIAAQERRWYYFMKTGVSS